MNSSSFLTVHYYVASYVITVSLSLVVMLKLKHKSAHSFHTLRSQSKKTCIASRPAGASTGEDTERRMSNRLIWICHSRGHAFSHERG